jgi:hypothetical protein
VPLDAFEIFFDLLCIKERAVNKIKYKVGFKQFFFFLREIYFLLNFRPGAEECIMGANDMHAVGVE